MNNSEVNWFFGGVEAALLGSDWIASRHLPAGAAAALSPLAAVIKQQLYKLFFMFCHIKQLQGHRGESSL